MPHSHMVIFEHEYVYSNQNDKVNVQSDFNSYHKHFYKVLN